MKDIKRIIAENLVALRKKNNLTQNELAEKLNYSDNTISRWEHAEITPSIETLEQISILFDVSIESLIKENGEISLTGKIKGIYLSDEKTKEESTLKRFLKW